MTAIDEEEEAEGGEGEGESMLPQHRMLFAAYHYSLSGMPPSKTVEFLCKACDKVLRCNTHTPVSKVRPSVNTFYPILSNPTLP